MSLQSPGVRDALQPQDGLYTLAMLDEQRTYRAIGAIREVAGRAAKTASACCARLAAPATHVVTLTVTEKGYCLDADGALELDASRHRHDLAHAATSSQR